MLTALVINDDLRKIARISCPSLRGLMRNDLAVLYRIPFVRSPIKSQKSAVVRREKALTWKQRKYLVKFDRAFHDHVVCYSPAHMHGSKNEHADRSVILTNHSLLVVRASRLRAQLSAVGGKPPEFHSPEVGL